MPPTSAPVRRFRAGIIFPKKRRRRPIVNCAIFSLAAICKKTIAPSVGAARAMLLPLFAFLVPFIRLRHQQRRYAVKMRVILASILVAAVASPAFAASYYVVQNSKTHKCAVTTKKPSEKSKTLALAGDGTAYASKT